MEIPAFWSTGHFSAFVEMSAETLVFVLMFSSAECDMFSLW